MEWTLLRDRISPVCDTRTCCMICCIVQPVIMLRMHVRTLYVCYEPAVSSLRPIVWFVRRSSGLGAVGVGVRLISLVLSTNKDCCCCEDPPAVGAVAARRDEP